jgi:hypothetical protein
MDENTELIMDELPVDEGSSQPDLPINGGSVDDDRPMYDRTSSPPAGGFGGSRRTCLLWAFVGALILGLMVLAVVVVVILDLAGGKRATPTPTRVVAYTTSTPVPTRTPTPTATRTPTPTPDVILLGVKALGELNTVEYNLKTVVEKDLPPIQIELGPLEIEGAHLHFLLVAGGHVKAGVDFGEMVRYEIVDRRVTVYLPAPRITDYYVDMRSLKPYYIRADPGLDEKFVVVQYNQAVVEAQESLRQAALESDILDAARTNARALVQSLILGLGFSEVEVRFLPPRGDETLELELPLELIPTLAPFPTTTPGG